MRSVTVFDRVFEHDDLAAVLAMSAYERAASAVATSTVELRDIVQGDRIAEIVTKHLLAHFSGLEAEFEQLLHAADVAADVGPLRASSG